MIQIFSAGRDGTDGRDQPKVVQEVLADLKRIVEVVKRFVGMEKIYCFFQADVCFADFFGSEGIGMHG